MYGNRHKCNNMSNATGQYVHTGHQVVTKNVAKCEFVAGIASLMVKTLGSGDIPQVQGLVAELVENLEITKALLTQSEVNASIDEWGVMLPDRIPLNVARNLFIKMYPRMAEIIQLLGSSSLMALPPSRISTAAGRGAGYLPGYRHRDGPRAGAPVPPGLGYGVQRVWRPAGAVREVFPGRLDAQRGVAAEHLRP